MIKWIKSVSWEYIPTGMTLVNCNIYLNTRTKRFIEAKKRERGREREREREGEREKEGKREKIQEREKRDSKYNS